MGWLILTRRIGETIRIGQNVKLTVLSTRSTMTRLGIDAPHDVQVDREEVWQRKQREKKEPDRADGLPERSQPAKV